MFSKQRVDTHLGPLVGRLAELTYPERSPVLQEFGDETSAAMCTVKPWSCAHYRQMSKPGDPAKVTEDNHVPISRIYSESPTFVLAIASGLRLTEHKYCEGLEVLP